MRPWSPLGRLETAVDFGGRIIEVAPDLVVQAGLVALERQQVVAAAVEDGLGDLCLRAHGVDGDEGPGQRQAFEQQRNGGDLVGLGLTRCWPSTRRWLLAQADTMWSGPRSLARSWVRREVLAVDGDDFGRCGRGRAGSRRVSTQVVKHWRTARRRSR